MIAKRSMLQAKALCVVPGRIEEINICEQHARHDAPVGKVGHSSHSPRGRQENHAVACLWRGPHCTVAAAANKGSRTLPSSGAWQ